MKAREGKKRKVTRTKERINKAMKLVSKKEKLEGN